MKTDDEMKEYALEQRVGQLLLQAGLTIGLAESCTGGLVASRLTDIAGSSAYLLGGIVAYSDPIKQRVLGVSAETLQAVGAVSSEVALQMARGARRVLETDIGVGITGIAGPGGGNPAAGKPVGLVFVALATAETEVCRRFVWPADRLGNKTLSADAALELVMDYLEGNL